MEFCLQTKVKGLYSLFFSIFIVWNLVFYILPRLNIDIINHNINKNIEANVYLYTEIEIKKEWSKQ